MPSLSADPREAPKSGCIQASFTRPSNVTQYTAGDVIGPVTTPANLTFSNAARYQGGGLVLHAVTLTKSTKNTTSVALDLYLFDTDPVAIADNAEWLPTDAEILNCVGVVEIVAADWKQSGGSTNALNAVASKSTLPVPLACAAGSRSLYGVLVSRGAWDPASAEVISVTLHVVRD